jgi:hypothetical protein
MMVRPGADTLDGEHPLGAARRAVAFICLALDNGSAAPDKLRHRVLLDGSVAEGPTITTHKGGLKVLGPPVVGTDWMAGSGLSIGAHHRSGLFVAGGLAQISRRYAIDWKPLSSG